MNTRSFSRKLLALVIAFLMVMSVASVALAGTKTAATVKYKRGDGTLTGASDQNYTVYNISGTSGKIDIALHPASVGTWTGYVLTGWRINGTTYTPGTTATGISVNRNSASSNWNDVEAVAQWTRTYVGSTLSHVDVEFAASVRVIEKRDNMVISNNTYPATVESVTSGTLTTQSGTSALSFRQYNSYEFRDDISFTHQPTNVVTLTVELRVNLGGGIYRNMSATKSFTGAALDAALALCPGSGSSKGYDIEVTTEDITEMFTHEVKFETQTGGTLTGTTTFSGILSGTAWGSAVTEPGRNPDNGYSFDGWYDENGNKIDADNPFPSTIIEDRTFTARWTKKPVAHDYVYIVDYTVTGGAANYNYLDVNVKNPATPPVIASTLSEPDKVFSGWNPASLNWGSLSSVDSPEVYDSTRGEWVITHTKTINVAGSFTNVAYTDIYELTFTGPAGAVLPGKKSGTGQANAPVLAGETATLSGHRFTGWSPASVTLGSYAENVGRRVISADGTQVTRYHEASVAAQFEAIAPITKYYYTVIYEIDGGTYDPGAPYSLNGAYYASIGSVPTGVAPDATPENGWSFAGWDVGALEDVASINWEADYVTESAPVVETEAGPEQGLVYRVYRTVTLTGTFEKNVVNRDEYTLTYTVTAPFGGLVGAPPAAYGPGVRPTSLAGVSVENGYTFDGWYQGTNPVNADSVNYTPGTVVEGTVAVPQTEGPYAGKYAFVNVTPHTAAVTGEVKKNGSVTTYVFNVEYYVDGVQSGATDTEALTSNNPTLELRGKPAVDSGREFLGWDATSLDWAHPDAAGSAGPFVNEQGLWETVITKTLRIDGETAQIEEVNVYTLTFEKGSYAAASVPDSITQTGAEPAVGTKVATLADYHFTGWTPGTLVYEKVGDPARVVSGTTGNKVVTYTQQWAESVVPLFVPIENQYLFNVTYTVDDTEQLDLKKESVPGDNENAGPTIAAKRADTADEVFDGWYLGSGLVDEINWSAIGFDDEGVGALSSDGTKWIVTYTKSAELTGSFSSVTHNYVYTLSFVDTIGTKLLADKITYVKDNPPNVAGETVTREGFYFKGWNPGSVSLNNFVWDKNETSTDKLTVTHYYKASVEAQFLPITYEYLFNVTYIVDSVEQTGLKQEDVPGDNENDGPEIEDPLEPADAIFNGWYLGSGLVDEIDWSEVDFGDPEAEDIAEGQEDENGNWVVTRTKSVTLTGSISNIEHVYVYELTFTGPDGAVLPTPNPATGEGAGNAPTTADKTASLANHSFTGWSDEITGADDYTAGPVDDSNPLRVVHHMVASVEAQFVPIGEEHIYTLTYVIDGELPEGVTLPAPQTGGVPFQPDQGNVPATVGILNFSGWTAANWPSEVQPEEIRDESGILIKKVYRYAATVTGSYSDMKTREGPTKYTLIYEGYVAGCIFWPADVIGVETPPVLAGAPYLAGYTFNGWTPGTLDWNTASATTSSEIVYPGEGEEFEPYILRTVTYEVRVRASFTGDEPIPTPTPEIPLGSPSTGGNDFAGFAAVLAALGAVIGTAAAGLKRRSRRQEEE